MRYTLAVRITGPYIVNPSSTVSELCDMATVKCMAAIHTLNR